MYSAGGSGRHEIKKSFEIASNRVKVKNNGELRHFMPHRLGFCPQNLLDRYNRREKAIEICYCYYKERTIGSRILYDNVNLKAAYFSRYESTLGPVNERVFTVQG